MGGTARRHHGSGTETTHRDDRWCGGWIRRQSPAACCSLRPPRGVAVLPGKLRSGPLHGRAVASRRTVPPVAKRLHCAGVLSQPPRAIVASSVGDPKPSRRLSMRQHKPSTVCTDLRCWNTARLASCPKYARTARREYPQPLLCAWSSNTMHPRFLIPNLIRFQQAHLCDLNQTVA